MRQTHFVKFVCRSWRWEAWRVRGRSVTHVLDFASYVSHRFFFDRGVGLRLSRYQAKALNNIRSATKSISEAIQTPMEVNLDMAVEYIQVRWLAMPRTGGLAHVVKGHGT